MRSVDTMSAIDEIERARNVLRNTRLDCFEHTSYSAEDLLRIVRACRESDWDITPCDLTGREIAYAASFGALPVYAIDRLKKVLG